MPTPYRARLDERAFLNFPGFHGGAYVVAWVEDTSERELEEPQPWLFGLATTSPRVILEIADCERRINLEFDLSSEDARANSLHKVDTLVAVLRRFREALAEEARLYEERERALAAESRATRFRRRRRRRELDPSH
ncbi:MAG TPA: hypothetical protein VM290_04445 [Gaiellaceae bacterium]|nr:hypothetical protein [Gaiellaceae bacterium]